MTKTEEKYRLRSEKVVNESWSKVKKYTDEVIQILEKKNLDDRDILILRIIARAFVQQSILEEADTIALFEVDPHML